MFSDRHQEHRAPVFRPSVFSVIIVLMLSTFEHSLMAAPSFGLGTALTIRQSHGFVVDKRMD